MTQEENILSEGFTKRMGELADDYIKKQGTHDNPHITRHDFVSGYLSHQAEYFSQLSAKSQECEELEAHRVNIKKENVDLKHHCIRMEAELSSLRAENEGLKDSLDLCATTINSLRAENELKDKRIAVLTEEVQELDESETDLALRLRKCEEENERLKKIIESDKETHERAEYSLRKRCEDLEAGKRKTKKLAK